MTLINISCDEILRATGGKLITGSNSIVFNNICTDSRRIEQGNLFVPLTGERFDGHDYIMTTFDSGAAGSLTQVDMGPAAGKVLIRVDNTLKALGDIAKYYRSKFNIPLVGITGSVGKTSTKDMVASVLNEKYNVLKTEGNFNNEIGLPLTLFNLDSSHNAAVIEMGMSGFGEISRLSRIAEPEIAIITNIGMAHIEKLGSRQNILKAKLEILEGLNKNGLVILNGDDELLSGLEGLLKFRTVFYGLYKEHDFKAYNIRTRGENGTYFNITIDNREYDVYIPAPGVHNVYNALAAIAAGIELKIPVYEIISGIGKFTPSKMRLGIYTIKGIKIINDAYNASPQSMEAAIDVLADLKNHGRTIAVLGDMLEMGEWAESAHMDVGKYTASKNIDTIIAVGSYGNYIAQGAMDAGCGSSSIKTFEDNTEAAEYLKGYVREGDVVLFKGSRGMKMEEIIKSLE